MRKTILSGIDTPVKLGSISRRALAPVFTVSTVVIEIQLAIQADCAAESLEISSDSPHTVALWLQVTGMALAKEVGFLLGVFQALLDQQLANHEPHHRKPTSRTMRYVSGG